uniref:class B sortase n=1 Tax=Acetatifactor sp. TaxID=1872090 RepID=UPI004055A8EC
MGEKMFLKIGKKGKIIAVIVAVIVVIGICVVGFSVYAAYRAEQVSEQKMEELRIKKENVSEPIIEDGKEDEEPLIPNPYADIFAQNEDMVGWLHIEGTNIDYPVMQTMEDENYYLRRDFNGNDDTAGCLLLDTDSSLNAEGTTNQIIHGHNMKTGIMFGELDLYEEEAYCKEHSRIQLITKEEERTYEVIAVFYSQVYYSTDLVFKYYNFFEADTEQKFQYFYDNIKELSLYDTGVEAEFGDRFITLSTCSYHVEDGRFVVIGKEVETTAFAQQKDAE